MKFDDKDEMEFYLLEELKIDKIDEIGRAHV